MINEVIANPDPLSEESVLMFPLKLLLLILCFQNVLEECPFVFYLLQEFSQVMRLSFSLISFVYENLQQIYELHL